MTDYVWPDDLPPYQQLFYLQPHVGRSESPFTKQQKIYGLSAPRWICRMAFRGGYDGTEAQGAFGPRLDALIALLEGGMHRVAIYDFRRTGFRGLDTTGAGNEVALTGETSMVLTGLPPLGTVLAGDYIGGDGRPHIITADAAIGGDGTATITFKPALAEDIGVDAAIFANPPGMFRLTSEDAGSNMTEVGGPVSYDLEFVEDLGPPTDVIFENEPVTYSG